MPAPRHTFRNAALTVLVAFALVLIGMYLIPV
jgi:hypothetical protein